MKTKAGQLVIHIFCCLCFLALPFIMRPGSFAEWGWKDASNQANMVAYVLLIGFFYLNFYVLIPKLYVPKKYIAFFSCVLACFLLVSFIPGVFIEKGNRPPMRREKDFNGGQMPAEFKDGPNDFGPPTGPAPNLHRPAGGFLFDKTSRYFFLFLAVFFFSLLLRISIRWQQTEKEKLYNELSYLRGQVNPHFLFNTLNSIYSLAIQKSDDTADAVVMLSGMMRYVLHDAAKDWVPLDKEMTYIEDFIALQKLRFGNTIPISFTVKGNMAGKQIAPLILMSFIENAFKHGVNAEEKSEIKIDIFIEEKELRLLVKNNKVRIGNTEEKSGLGIENTKKRLQHLYPKKHELKIVDSKDYFSVSLALQF
jgi:hypothetical protein